MVRIVSLAVVVMVFFAGPLSINSGSAQTVEALINPKELHSGETATVTAKVRLSSGTRYLPNKAIEFKPQIGTVLPKKASTGPTGGAVTTTYRAPVVDRSTEATVDVQGNQDSHKLNVTIHPPDAARKVFFAGVNTLGTVIIKPKVSEVNNQWVWTYTFEEINASENVDAVDVIFQKPVTMSPNPPPSGTVAAPAAAITNSKIWLIKDPKFPLTLSFGTDAEPGGEAVWEVRYKNFSRPRTGIAREMKTTGPK